MKYILALLLLASPAMAEPTTQAACEALLANYARLEVDVEQAGLALNVQKGIVEICNKLIQAEQPKPTPEPAKEEVK